VTFGRVRHIHSADVIVCDISGFMKEQGHEVAVGLVSSFGIYHYTHHSYQNHVYFKKCIHVVTTL